jgi:ABC-type sugar transport system permease subunit
MQRAARRPQFWFAASGLLPALAWYGLFFFRPFLRALQIAFTDYDLLSPRSARFVGLGNFRGLLEHPLFTLAVRNSVFWAILVMAMVLPLGLLLAQCLVGVRRGRNLYQSLIFSPVVVSLVAVSLLFRMLMDPQVGQFNQILRSLHLPESHWIVDSSSALPSCALICVWKGLGFHVVILTTGLLNIPGELYDAARVDGAGSWQRFWQLTFPLLRPTLTLDVVILTIGTLQEFTLPQVLTGGGPANATYMYNMLIYNLAFQGMRFSAATAAAVLLLLAILVISLLQLRLIRPNWSY